MPQKQQQQPPDGHWQWVPSDRPKEPASKSSAAGTALFFVGILLLSQCLIGWKGIQAFQRLMNRHDAQIQSVEQSQ